MISHIDFRFDLIGVFRTIIKRLTTDIGFVFGTSFCIFSLHAVNSQFLKMINFHFTLAYSSKMISDFN
jgi:hypothetical protein